MAEADMYNVEIDWAPAYELWISLFAFTSKSDQKTLDLGMDWVRAVSSQITPGLREKLDDAGGGVHFPIQLLIKQAPGDRSPRSFLTWLASLSPGDLYERVQPWVVDDAKQAASKIFMLRDLAENRDAAVELLGEWDAQYFSSADPRILHGLENEAEARRSAKTVDRK